MLILNSLEEIKTYLNDFFKLSKPVVLINEISITNKTTLLTQQLFFEATVTLPQKEQEYFQVFSKINNYINGL